MACLAQSEAGPFAGIDLIDPPQPDSGPLHQRYGEEELRAVFDAELAQAGTGGAQRGGEGARAYADRLARCCRANLLAMAGHRVRPLAATPARLWLAARPEAGMPAPPASAARLAAWAPYLPQREARQVLDTTHYGIVRGEHAGTVAAAIDASLTGGVPGDT
jgi:thioesterase domain-containing protein